MTFNIQKPCPSCRQAKSIFLNKNNLSCSNTTCSFSINFPCPLCSNDLPNDCFSEDALGPLLKCPSCQNQIHLKRIQHLIDNALVVDQKQRCHICNGATIHRQDANIGHRCFFFPKCSGQADLFSSKKESLVFLDFETTGLEPEKDHIIEIGALKIDDEGFEHTFQQLIKPPTSVPERITQITGITNDMLINSSSIESVLPEFIRFIGDATLVAHNSEFDVPWLLINAARLSLSLPKNEVICTLKWARALKERSGSLGALCKQYHIGHANAHRALADAAATKELFFIFENKRDVPKPLQPLSDYEQRVSNIIGPI